MVAIIRTRRDDRGDPVQGELPRRPWEETHAISCPPRTANGRPPAGGHSGGVDVADQHLMAVQGGLLQQCDRDARVDADPAQRCGGNPAQDRDRGGQALRVGSGQGAHRSTKGIPGTRAPRRRRSTIAPEGILGRRGEPVLPQGGKHLRDGGL